MHHGTGLPKGEAILWSGLCYVMYSLIAVEVKYHFDRRGGALVEFTD